MNELIEQTSSSIATSLNAATSVVSVVSGAVNDIKLTWKYMIYIAIIALGISLVSMIIIRYFAAIFVWLTLLIFIACFFALAVYAGKESDTLALSGDSSTNSYYTSTNLKAASIICYIIAGLSLLVVLFYI